MGFTILGEQLAKKISGKYQNRDNRNSDEERGRPFQNPECGAGIINACQVKYAGPYGKTFPLRVAAQDKNLGDAVHKKNERSRQDQQALFRNYFLFFSCFSWQGTQSSA